LFLYQSNQSLRPKLILLFFPPHLTESSDPEFDDYNRKFTAIETGTEKILKDSKVFRDAVQTLLYSGSSFSTSFNTLFAPLGAEYDLGSKFPNSEVTIKNIGGYQALMEDLRGESRVCFFGSVVVTRRLTLGLSFRLQTPCLPHFRLSCPSFGSDLTETLNPELELIDSRIIVPCKELQEICKRIRKTIVKRDHKVGLGWRCASSPLLSLRE